MKAETETKILNSNTIREYLETLQSDFDCKNCKPSGFIKATIVYTLTNMLGNMKPTNLEVVKVKFVNSPNIHEAIEVIKSNFDLNEKLTGDEKINLLANTTKLIMLTRLQEASAKKETKDDQGTSAGQPADKKTSLVDEFKNKFKRKKK